MSLATDPASLSAPARAAAAYRRGALLVAGSTVLFSIAGLLARWLGTDPWTTLFWRSVFATLTLLLCMVARDGSGVWASFQRLGRVGLGMAACFAISMICFVNALALTTVATVMVFQAAAPLFAATLAWIFLKERVGRLKLGAILVTLFGVLVMVAGSPGGESVLGAVLSVVMTIAFAGSIVLARVRPDVPTTAAVCVAVAAVSVVSLPMAALWVTPRDLGLLAVFGAGQMGAGLLMFTTGVVLIPAADAGLISVLEAILAPIWVWLVVGENPGRNTVIGGTIVVLAVIAVARWGRDST
jgi:drug/metabolite transporter (DMT)-like permease